MTPYISEKLGIEAYGFINLANTIISYVDIIAVAFNAFAARYIALAYHNKDYTNAESYFNSVLFANIIFSVIVSAFSSVVILKLENILSIPDRLSGDIKILFLLVLLNYFISLLANVFSIPAFVKNFTSITSRNSSISKIIYLIILLAIIFTSSIRVFSMTMALCISSFLLLFQNYLCSKKMMQEIRINLHSFSIQKIKTLLSSGIWNSINNIGGMLNTGLDLLITNQMLSSIIMGQISVAKQISNIITSLSFLISNAFQPKQLEAYAKGNTKDLIRYLCIAMKCMGIIGGLVMAVFGVMGKQFLQTWIPGQDIETLFLYSIVILLGDILVIIGRPLFYVNTLTDKIRVVCGINIISGVLNVISMFVLIRYFSMKGMAIIITTAVLNIITGIILTPLLAAHFLKLENKYVFLKIIVRHLLTTALCVFILHFVGKLLHYEASWSSVILNGMILSICGLIIMILGELSRKELKEILSIICQKWRKKTNG